MEIAGGINFSGRRWPAARVTGTQVQGLKTRRVVFGLAASGNGQLWHSDRPLAFWRNFSELDLSVLEAKSAVLRFLARHGDPTGRLARDNSPARRRPARLRTPLADIITGKSSSDTAAWLPLVALFEPIAAAGTKPMPSASAPHEQ